MGGVSSDKSLLLFSSVKNVDMWQVLGDFFPVSPTDTTSVLSVWFVAGEIIWNQWNTSVGTDRALGPLPMDTASARADTEGLSLSLFPADIFAPQRYKLQSLGAQRTVPVTHFWGSGKGVPSCVMSTLRLGTELWG